MLVFAGGALVFAFLLYRAGVQGLLRDLRSTGWVLAPIVAVWGLVYVSNTVAWEQLLRAGTPPSASGSRGTIPFLQAYAITIASFAINYVTPFVALGGEPFRVASATPWVGTDRAAASVVSFRVTHTLGQVLFWLIAVPVAWVLLPHSVATDAALALVAVVMCVAATFLVSLFRRGFLIRALAIVHRTPLLRRLGPRIDQVRGTLEHIDEQMAALTSGERQHLIVAVIAEVLGRCLAMLEYFFIARAMGLHIGYPTAFVIGAFSQLAINLTVFIPFELGSKEGGLYLIFELLGLPPALGVYASVLSRLRELTWIAIGLTMVWVSGRRTSRRSAAA
jgi:uncharacterized protein (TIRG00374 family)